MQPYVKDQTRILQYRGTQRGEGLLAGSTTVSSGNITLRRVLNGYKHPQWRQMVQDGLNAATQLDADYMSAESRPTWCALSRAPGCGGNPASGNTVFRGDLAFLSSGLIMDPANPGYSPSLTSADNRAVAELYGRVRELQTVFQGLVFLGELQEAKHMMYNRAEKIFNGCFDYVRQVKKLKRMKPKDWHHERFLSQLWLEASFGWKPLLMDVKSAAAAIRQYVERPKVKRFKASGVAQSNGNTVFASNLNATALGALWYKTRTTSSYFRRVTYRGAYRFQAETTCWQDKSLFGFDPKDFIPAAWELLPWSFLADYFSNIGDILEAVTTSTAGVSFLVKTTQDHRQIFRHTEWDVDKMKSQYACPSYISVETGGPGWGYTRAKKVTRRLSTMPDIPTLELTLPGTDSQLLNIAALLAQTVGIHPQRRFDRRGVPYTS